MGINFKEVATLRGDDKKFEENFSKIQWATTEGERLTTLDHYEREESPREVITCYAVINAHGRVVSYLDSSMGSEFEVAINHYKDNGHKIVKLTGQL